ncbi:hypothetical protein AAL_05414 [Moelleriella libera RCEF 2490]|uniref:Uncharacterized protein n=1 Tax=Moelleriella libera RCEF 2490 TaxID=1081109 RepID=A0A168AAW0_9HYPO|nr:hypothetical protein AAL_05414 [Moelleriella libera RCEF 2490]
MESLFYCTGENNGQISWREFCDQCQNNGMWRNDACRLPPSVPTEPSPNDLSIAPADGDGTTYPGTVEEGMGSAEKEKHYYVGPEGEVDSHGFNDVDIVSSHNETKLTGTAGTESGKD